MTESRRLRFLADVAVSNVDKKTQEGQVDVLLCNYVDVYYHERIHADLDFMVATATSDQVKAFSLKRGDILITKDSETPEDIAVPAQVVADLQGVVCGYHLAVIRPIAGLMDSRYLFWVVSSTVSRQYFSAAAQGITRFGLRRDAILDLPVPVPPVEDQRRIANLLDAETARIDRLIDFDRRPSAVGAAKGEIGGLINLLRERRDALVAAAVSGQLDIRGLLA